MTSKNDEKPRDDKKLQNQTEESEKARDLASLVGLDPKDAEDGARRFSVKNGQARRRKEVGSPQRQIDKKGDPGLWMDTPKRYPALLENMRAVKNKLLKLKEEFGAQAILFTGSERKSGVSTLAINLGLVLANDLMDQRILMVDANLSSPSLHNTFGLPREPGLMDYLLKGFSISETTASSHLPNMDLMTVGEIDEQVTSPFDLLRFLEFLEEGRRIYDFIIIDAAPALHSSHCRTLSTKVDGVITIAEANVTRWEVLLELKRLLESDGAKLVGGILNKRKFVIPKWVYRFI